MSKSVLNWVGFSSYVVFNTVALSFFGWCHWRSTQNQSKSRKRKAVVVRSPELVLCSLFVSAIQVCTNSMGWYHSVMTGNQDGYDQGTSQLNVMIQYQMDLACVCWLAAMICCLALRMDWQFSLGKLEMARVWKSELNMQVKRAWVLSLTPLLRSSRGLIATCLALSLILTIAIVSTISIVVFTWKSLTSSVMIAVHNLLSMIVLIVLIVAYRDTSAVNDGRFGMRREMKWVASGWLIWSVSAAMISSFLRIWSDAWIEAHHWLTSGSVCLYYWMSVYLPSSQLNQHNNDHKHQSILSMTGSRTGLVLSRASASDTASLPSVSLSLLRRVLSNYDSFVLLTEHCVSEMSVEGILFIVWYMRAKQLLFAFLRDRDMFDYDSVPVLHPQLGVASSSNSSSSGSDSDREASTPGSDGNDRRRRVSFNSARSKFSNHNGNGSSHGCRRKSPSPVTQRLTAMISPHSAALRSHEDDCLLLQQYFCVDVSSERSSQPPPEIGTLQVPLRRMHVTSSLSLKSKPSIDDSGLIHSDNNHGMVELSVPKLAPRDSGSVSEEEDKSATPYFVGSVPLSQPRLDSHNVSRPDSRGLAGPPPISLVRRRSENNANVTSVPSRPPRMGMVDSESSPVDSAGLTRSKTFTMSTLLGIHVDTPISGLDDSSATESGIHGSGLSSSLRNRRKYGRELGSVIPLPTSILIGSEVEKNTMMDEKDPSLTGVIDVLHLIFDQFIIDNSVHSVNVSNDARVSALRTRSRLDSGLALELDESRQIRLLLKCILMLDRVLSEVMRVIKNDIFLRFRDTEPFEKWYHSNH